MNNFHAHLSPTVTPIQVCDPRGRGLEVVPSLWPISKSLDFETGVERWEVFWQRVPAIRDENGNFEGDRYATLREAQEECNRRNGPSLRCVREIEVSPYSEGMEFRNIPVLSGVYKGSLEELAQSYDGRIVVKEDMGEAFLIRFIPARQRVRDLKTGETGRIKTDRLMYVGWAPLRYAQCTPDGLTIGDIPEGLVW